MMKLKKLVDKWLFYSITFVSTRNLIKSIGSSPFILPSSVQLSRKIVWFLHGLFIEIHLLFYVIISIPDTILIHDHMLITEFRRVPNLYTQKKYVFGLRIMFTFFAHYNIISLRLNSKLKSKINKNTEIFNTLWIYVS